MSLMAFFEPVDWLVLLIDPRAWGIAAVAVFAWRPFHWPRRLLLALVTYLVLAVLLERAFGTFFADKLYSQFAMGMIATALWFWVLQRVRRAFAREN